MKLLSDENLQLMWSVATSTSSETGTPPHQIFARLLYNRIMKVTTQVEKNHESQSCIGPTS
jgi:hypothetical protein